MTAALRDEQFARCCDALDAVERDAPTLCEGWTAHDLALHLWVLKHDPLAWPGVGVPALERLTTRGRVEAVRSRWSYDELLRRLRAGSGAIAAMPLDRFEGYRHALGEYYVHTQDVVRANELPQEPPSEEMEEALWLRVKVAAAILHLHRTPGLVLVRPNGAQAKATLGRARKFVHGQPSELMCWAYGRRAGVDVR